MKKTTFLAIICLFMTNSLFSQNNYNWITPNRTYLKLYTNTDGIQRINKSDFTNAGINTSGLDPRTVKVLYKGNEIPIFFQGENDGVFDDADYFDFYGKRNSGGLTNFLDANSNATVYTNNEYNDLFTDTSVYWAEWGGSNGLRMQVSQFSSSVNYQDNYFYKNLHFEKDLYYYLGETINPNTDYRYFSTERIVGETWYWKLLTTDNFIEESFQINDLASSQQLCSLKIFAYPRSYTTSILNEHRLILSVNGNLIDTLKRDNLKKFDTTVTFSSSLLNNNSQNTVNIRYVPLNPTFFSPYVDIDFFNVTYPRNFNISNNNISINLNGTDTTSKKFTVPGYNSVNQTNIYDIRNNIKINPDNITSGVLTFTGKSNSSFAIINENITLKPFRIVSRQVKDLVSASNAADYLIVYNKIFETQAEELRNHRQNFSNFRSVKAEMQDIYDIFNYGIENPVAVRNFVKYAYENWQSPGLKYVCLMGRASLDPKKNSAGSVYYQNLVPTYGNPPTDGYFVNFNIGTFTYFHQISVGRLPVYTTTEAQNVVNKIITYDTQQPEKWWKNFIFITGGPDRAQQIQFQAKSNNLVNQYITPPPTAGQTAKIYRNDSTGYITYNYKDSIKKEFDRGSMIVNFIGHAAAQDWEIGLEDVNSLNNQGRQPLVLSFTCYTGRNSETNIRSFGESFILLPGKCAIGFVGTTGWSFAGSGDSFNDNILKNFSRDSVRSIGDVVSYASRILGRDSLSFSSRNTVNCYNLLGDPATKLLLPVKPEFDITQNDYALSNPFPAIGENIKLSVFPKNLGTAIDSLRIRFNLKNNGVISQSNDTLIRNFYYTDTLNHFFVIDSVGNYTMSVILDPDRTYSQKFTNNDSITFPLTLRNLSFLQIKPLNNAILNNSEFKFTGLNPNADYRSNSVKIILQVDTARAFNSPVVQTFMNSNISGVSSNFNVTVPILNTNTLYFLRTNAVINGDSSGWSEIQNVIYNPGISDIRVNDSTYTLYTTDPQQYNGSDLFNVTYSPQGFVLDKFKGNLFIKSLGSNGNEASYFTINGINSYSDGGTNLGLNIAKVKKLTGKVSSIRNFTMTSPFSSDSVMTFLNTFDSTDYLMAYNCSYVAGADSLRGNAKAKLREFGSRYIDSIKLGWFDSWAFFGYLGADSLQTCESYHLLTQGGWEQSVCQINPQFQQTSGSISQTFGSADKWKEFSWDQVINPGSILTFDVFGIRGDNTATVLYTGLTTNSNVNLDTINSTVYPYIKLTANLSIDTVSGLESPVYKSTTFKYIPPPELLPDNYSFTARDTAVQEGDSIEMSVSYYNVGFIDAKKYIAKWYVKDQGVESILRSDTVTSPLGIDSSRDAYVKFSTAGLRDPKLTKDTVDIYFETYLADNENEIIPANNIAVNRFIVEGDSINPNMVVTYDGISIQDRDYIKSKPDIKLEFFDDSRLVISDTSNVKVYTYNFQTQRYVYVPYTLNGAPNPVIRIGFPDDPFLQATVNYTPDLSAGEHRFRFSAYDNSGNLADSIFNTVIVDKKMSIVEMANYPNPMKTETQFTFKLSGDLNPTSCKVKIYTVAGRLVKEINAAANIGYNQIPWDGKDSDGEFMANGTYLYKFIIQGNSETETSIQKLAILR
ncbi:MAG TPA: C25 family cysteine peptidase [Ignavibacteria bacterium]|nr:C25 family cysteine peptidase [Ignavibacteria bacterium]